MRLSRKNETHRLDCVLQAHTFCNILIPGRRLLHSLPWQPSATMTRKEREKSQANRIY